MQSAIKNELPFSSNVLSEMSDYEKKYYETDDGWLDIKKIIDEIQQFGALIGARNVGKTYGTLEYTVSTGLKTIIKKYDFSDLEGFEKMPTTVKSDYQFAYLRRYATQAKAAAKKLILEDFYKDFLSELPSNVLEKYEYYIDFEGGSEEPREIYLVFRDKEVKKNKRRILIGWIGALTMAEKFRGPGIPEVKLIIVDEFQSKKNWDYLPNEPVELEDIYESIGRLRCGTGDIKVVLLGNSGTILNPYFEYYNYDEFDQMRTEKRDGEVIIYHLPNKAKRSEKSKNLFKGSAYGCYSIDNNYADNQEFNIVRLKEAPNPRKCLYSMYLGDTKIGVWIVGDNKTVISKINDPQKPTFVDRMPLDGEHLDQQVYMVLSSKIQNKMLYFDSPELRLIAEKHLRKYLFRKKEEWEVF